MTENKKPFGLKLACNMAGNAIKQSVAPVSIILYNLLYLQKDNFFPKNLDVQFFATPRKFVTDQDKRVVAKILDKLRSPHLDTSSLLEDFVKDEWVVKKLPVKETVKKETVKNSVEKTHNSDFYNKTKKGNNKNKAVNNTNKAVNNTNRAVNNTNRPANDLNKNSISQSVTKKRINTTTSSVEKAEPIITVKRSRMI